MTTVNEHAGATYEAMKANLLEHLRGLFPIEGKVHRLVLTGVDISDTADPGDYAAQKDARMNGRTWSVPVTARLELRTIVGNKLVDRAKMKIIDLPRLTNRGSYIVGGSEYMFPIQKRLRSGPYVRLGQNNELRTFFNMKKGRNFHLGIHPEKGHFQFQVDTSKNLPLYPLLRALGVSDDAMVRAWGREAFTANVVRDGAVSTKALKSIYEKMTYGGEAPAPDALPEALRATFSDTQMDGDNTELTLGKKFDNASGEALLAASAKMLRVGRGDEKEDNRDSLIHNDIVDLADFVVERFKDYQFRNRITRTIKFNIDRRDKISRIISRDAFQRPVSSLFTESQLSQSPIQTNPLGMISDYTQVTVRGEGGIQQDNALTKGLRALDPSHLGFLDPAHTPEGQGVGTTLHLTTAARKKGRDLVTRVIDVSTGREVEITPTQLWKSTVAFPEAVDPKTKRLRRGLSRVKATHAGEVSVVPVGKVRYAFAIPEHLIDVNTATIPFTSHNNGARVMLASKLGVQAKPLADADQPLVQSAIAGEKGTVERAVGEAFAPKSPIDGVVEKISDDYIQISGRKVSLPNYFPLNNNNFMHARPRVKVGDRVKKGEVLADTNYTKDGELALGKNLTVAYVPYKGMNVEDGVVISRSAAAKMTSEHLYQQPYMFDADTVLDLKRFRTYFPAKVTEDQAKKLDDKGVVKKGQEIKPGDILVLSMRKAQEGTESQQLARVSRMLARDYRDDSMTWDKDVDGVVQDVAWRPNEVVIHVRTKEPMRVGDKIVGRYANKGIVVHIVPDDEMPRGENNEPVDMLLNPNGVVSRMNLGQILETTASRIVDKTGKPFVARGFGDDSATRIASELKRLGLKDHETLFDPVENAKIPGVLVGKQYIYKLEHQATKKMSARGGGADEEYTDDEQPVRGKVGGRGIGSMELYALLAHGALANVQEMYGIKSSFDPEMWRAVEEGRPLPAAKKSFAHNKFEALLKGMGIDMRGDDKQVALVPFLDRDVKALSNGEITDHKLVRGKDLKEEKGGLFDTKKTGGVRGDRWTHVRLAEPVPNPTFERAVLALLRMKKAEFDDIMAGRKKVGALTGGRAIKHLLDQIKVNERLKAAKAEAVGKSGSELNALHREIRFLTTLKDQKLKPSDYVIEYMPVLPPRFRPVYKLPDGNLNVSDLNFHYQALMQLNNQVKELKGPAFADKRRELSPSLYKAVGGVMGLNDGIVERAQTPKGIAKVISGKGSPKGGFLHKRLLKRRQDVSATNVIVSNPKLGMDEIGLPEATAWKTFRPFVIRELRGMGLTPLAAKKEIDDKTPRAKKVLEKVVANRHVIINRAPTLHKFSVMAFKPRLVSGYALELPPLIVGGFNADFDGDNQINRVLVLLPDYIYNSDVNYWQQREVNVAARFKTTIGFHDGDGRFVVCDLSEFPHSEEMVTQGHIDFHPAAPGIKVVAIDEDGGPVLADVSGWSFHRQRRVEIVTLGSGRQIITDDDERAVYGLDAGSLTWCRRRPSEAAGQFVPVVDHEPVSPDVLDRVPLPDNARLNDEVELDFDAGYFFGAIVGDGWASFSDGQPKAVNLGSSVQSIVDRWKSSSAAVFRDEPVFTDSWLTEGKLGQSQGSGRATVTCASLAGFVAAAVGHGAANKHLPPFSFRAPRRFVEGLLSGMWDTDGSMSWSNAKTKPQFMCSYSSTSIRLVQELQHLLRTVGVTATITDTKTPTGAPAWMLGVSIVDLHRAGLDIDLAHDTKAAAWRKFVDGSAPSDRGSYSRNRLVPVPSDLARELRSQLTVKGNESMYQTLTKAVDRQYMSRAMAVDLVTGGVSCSHPLFDKWRQIVTMPGVYFERVKNVRVTDVFEDGYDLTVPGYETFMSGDGIVLSNTMGIHVPVSAEANAEAGKMLPSKHLYKPGSKKLQPKIEHEYVLGLFKISRVGKPGAKRYTSTGAVLSDLQARKIDPDAGISVTGIGSTTPGRVLINEALPAKLRDYGQVWTNKAITEKLVEVDKVAGRQAFVRTLQSWADIGRRYAYLTGSSFLLSDLQTMTSQRNAAYRRADIQANRIRMGPGSDAEKKKRIVKLYMDVSGRLSSSMNMGKNQARKTNNVMDMMQAGARGNPAQVRQMVSNIGVMLDHENKAMAEPVRGTYTEGLDSAEFFQHMYGNRKGMIDRSQSVRDPGALTKQVIVSAAGYRVSTTDCGTTSGIMEPTTGDTAMDRYLAEPVPGVGTRATVVTSSVLAAARKKGLKQIKVRSPLTCRAAVGVCARCYGLDEEGKVPPVGEHVGIKDSQGLTEPSTQLAMKTFHSGGVATGKASLTTGFDRVKQLFTMPNQILDKATLAEIAGRVDAVRARPQGGSIVTIAGRDHRVAAQRRVTVKVGDVVEKGQQLTDGDAQPQDVLRLRGMRQLQRKLRDDIQAVYAAGGEHISTKAIEAPVRMLTDSVRISDPGDHPSLVTGDYSTFSSVDAWNRANTGKRLVRFTHQLPGSEFLPHRSDDWARRMAHNRIQQVLTEAPASGAVATVQGESPFAALITGKRIEQDPWSRKGVTNGG